MSASIIYPLFGNWVWGGGWLSQLGANFGLGHGYLDFAGSARRAHAVGGVDRRWPAPWCSGRASANSTRTARRNAIPGHNIPMAILGTFILAFGWFGFNPGSTLARQRRPAHRASSRPTRCSPPRAAPSAAMFYMWGRSGKPDPSMTVNGLLAGLVAITAPCALRQPRQRRADRR